MVEDNHFNYNNLKYMDYSETSHLTFLLDGETFAVNVAHITEVLEFRNITKVPQVPDFMKGVINLRGDVIPIISLRHKLNMNEIESTDDMVIIVLCFTYNKKIMKIGAVADKVNEVTTILPEDIQLFPDITSNYNPEFINGMHKYLNSFVIILNINTIIHSVLKN